MRAGQDTPWLKKEKRVLKRCAKRGQGNRDHLEATGLCASGIPSDGGLTKASGKCKAPDSHAMQAQCVCAVV